MDEAPVLIVILRLRTGQWGGASDSELAGQGQDTSRDGQRMIARGSAADHQQKPAVEGRLSPPRAEVTPGRLGGSGGGGTGRPQTSRAE